MKKTLLFLIRKYQQLFSPDTGTVGKIIFPFKACRFKPTCSQYTYVVVDQHGIINGLWLALKRLVRCHPWNKGGYDPPPQKNPF